MKVCIGLSGGVDSSVAALLLKQQGYDVFAMFMQNWHDAESTLHGECEWEEDRFVAEMVARRIGIPFYFVDLSKTYRQKVVDYMFDEYERGRTPNPDVLCNREIKFAAFWEEAKKLGAEMVATGHYCRKDIVRDASGKAVLDSHGKEIYRLLAGEDKNKDQSYFLCQLNQEQLASALFPIGDIDKSEVRRLAREAELPSADKKDSQGICFVGKVDLPTFLKQKLREKQGDIVEVFSSYYKDDKVYAKKVEILQSLTKDATVPELTTSYISEDKSANIDLVEVFDDEKLRLCSDEDFLFLSRPLKYDFNFETETYRSGRKRIKKIRYKEHPYAKIIAQHNGAHFYTIGQRKGLNVGGHKDSLFVISTDIEKNIIYVGEGHRHQGLSQFCIALRADELHYVREDLAMQSGEIRHYKLRLRYRQPLQDAVLIMRENYLFILFQQAQRGITAGQFAVIYDGQELIASAVV